MLWKIPGGVRTIIVEVNHFTGKKMCKHSDSDLHQCLVIAYLLPLICIHFCK